MNTEGTRSSSPPWGHVEGVCGRARDSRNSFDLISRLFRSFFFLDNYGLGDNLKINLSLSSKFTQATCLAPLTVSVGADGRFTPSCWGLTGVFQDSGARGLLPPLAWSSCWELREGLAIAWREQSEAPGALSWEHMDSDVTLSLWSC